MLQAEQRFKSFHWKTPGSQYFDLSVCFYVSVLTCEEKIQGQQNWKGILRIRGLFRDNGVTVAPVQFSFPVIVQL